MFMLSNLWTPECMRADLPFIDWGVAHLLVSCTLVRHCFAFVHNINSIYAYVYIQTSKADHIQEASHDWLLITKHLSLSHSNTWPMPCCMLTLDAMFLFTVCTLERKEVTGMIETHWLAASSLFPLSAPSTVKPQGDYTQLYGSQRIESVIVGGLPFSSLPPQDTSSVLWKYVDACVLGMLNIWGHLIWSSKFLFLATTKISGLKDSEVKELCHHFCWKHVCIGFEMSEGQPVYQQLGSTSCLFQTLLAADFTCCQPKYAKCMFLGKVEGSRLRLSESFTHKFRICSNNLGNATHASVRVITVVLGSSSAKRIGRILPHAWLAILNV